MTAARESDPSIYDRATLSSEMAHRQLAFNPQKAKELLKAARTGMRRVSFGT